MSFCGAPLVAYQRRAFATRSSAILEVRTADHEEPDHRIKKECEFRPLGDHAVEHFAASPQGVSGVNPRSGSEPCLDAFEAKD
jgi:hypothetical protein